MAKKKYFLGSVGTVEAFHKVDGRLELAFRSKTLTDSGINISTVKDDIRAGTGAPVQFSFYHDTSAEITLTDVLFDESYVAAQLGAQFVTGGLAYTSEDKATPSWKDCHRPRGQTSSHNRRNPWKRRMTESYR